MVPGLIEQPMSPILMLAPVVEYSSEVQQPIRATAVLGGRPQTYYAAPLGREQGYASSLHPGGLAGRARSGPRDPSPRHPSRLVDDLHLPGALGVDLQVMRAAVVVGPRGRTLARCQVVDGKVEVIAAILVHLEVARAAER
jgi:hypothetical protein